LEGREYTVQYFERRRMELHPERAGTPYEVQLGLLGRDIYAAAGGVPVPPPAGDLPASIQQPILNAAWARLQPGYPATPLMIGLVDVAGDYAFALDQPQGRPEIHVFLKRQSGGWKVIVATATPMPEPLNKQGVPAALQGYSEPFAVIVGTLAQLQDARGDGLSGYVTRPRVAGDYARFWVAPADSENRDTATMFFKRSGGTWRYLSAGRVFPEDDQRALGVPQELWPYGDSVHGPAK